MISIPRCNGTRLVEIMVISRDAAEAAALEAMLQSIEWSSKEKGGCP